ncbi:hypothetical protein GCM10008107_12390 [Psychrosphaera saromensis]|nr:hypothetical protein GCM10008107_12390 [Psychrosphaera saromensis]GLQ15742.1 hypothetical protein GCM10007917_31970 [Psychrosphaera saromensis]
MTINDGLQGCRYAWWPWMAKESMPVRYKESTYAWWPWMAKESMRKEQVCRDFLFAENG